MSLKPPPPSQPPRPNQPPPPPPSPYPPQQVQHVVHHYRAAPKSSGSAVLLEILPGFFFQTFGIRHLYAGNVAAGVLLLFGQRFLQFLKPPLCFVLVGLLTPPPCFILPMITSPLTPPPAALRAPRAPGPRSH